MPGRLLTLDSKIDGFDVRLHQMRSLTASIGQHPAMANTKAHRRLQNVMSRVSKLVKELRELSTQVKRSENGQFLIGPAQHAGAWEGHLDRLREIENDLSELQLALDRLLDTPMLQQEVLERLLELVDKQIETAEIVVTEQLQKLERAQSVPKCVCRRAQRSATPSFLSRILGQLFLEHAVTPRIGTKCASPTCINAQAPRLYAEYWSPLGKFWPQILRFRATYRPSLCPSLQLSTLRRIPDSAPAIGFAMSGNIRGLQDLFRRGAASPQDVSDTRGYSLIRVSVFRPPCNLVLGVNVDGRYSS
jgi:hypothetical protein